MPQRFLILTTRNSISDNEEVLKQVEEEFLGMYSTIAITAYKIATQRMKQQQVTLSYHQRSQQKVKKTALLGDLFFAVGEY